MTGDRRVLVIFGPPGAGKTTHARRTGLDVYDYDDPIWHNRRQFHHALEQIAADPVAHAAVIGSGATPTARTATTTRCGATETLILPVPLDECIRRITRRERPNKRAQIAGAHKWWADYQPDASPDLGRPSRDW